MAAQPQKEAADDGAQMTARFRKNGVLSGLSSRSADK
jgi:hypothetical protein